MAAIVLFSGAGVIAGDFTDNGDGTVTDGNTGLMWQQAEAGSMDWEAAITYCESFSLPGYTDWRLPNVKELRSIVDDRLYNPAIDKIYFPGALASYYWSSTTYADGSSDAWGVVFGSGSVHYYSKTIGNYVRCVRGGQ